MSRAGSGVGGPVKTLALPHAPRTVSQDNLSPEAGTRCQDFVGTRIGSFHTCDFINMSEGKDMILQSTQTQASHFSSASHSTLQIVALPTLPPDRDSASNSLTHSIVRLQKFESEPSSNIISTNLPCCRCDKYTIKTAQHGPRIRSTVRPRFSAWRR